MFQVKVLAKGDFSFAVDLANTINWNMAVEDFEFMTSLEPNGCFLLTDGPKRVGIATCNAFGEVGWFGNLIVEKSYRNRGAGSMLVRHALQYLKEKGTKTVGLYAYPALTHFYGNLGFVLDEDYSVLKAEKLSQVNSEPFPKIDQRWLPEIAEFDHKYFGGNRKKLLESIIQAPGNAGYYIEEGGQIIGYVAATIYESMAWVGPLICHPERYNIAISLVQAVLSKVAGREVYAVVSKNDIPLMNAFFKVGFKESFIVSRMFLGRAVAKNCICMAESLERG
jgi:predicted N-acetyltransferase YhbS